MGALLDEIYERQLDGQVRTTEEGIALARRLLDERARSERSAEDARVE
jgi:hypothetical protein